MKCRAYLFHIEGKKKPHIVPLYTFGATTQPHYEKVTGVTLGGDFTICDGEIVVVIEAESEPSWGGSYPVLEVTYQCNKCNNKVFPELPNDLEIGEFVTGLLAIAPEGTREELLNKRLKER